MAACGSLQHIFENPLPESPTFLESLSPWKAIKNMKPVENCTFQEIFGELHFKERNHPVVVVDVDDHSSSSALSESIISPSPSSSSSSSIWRSSSSSVSQHLPSFSGDGIEISPTNNNKNNDDERSKSPVTSSCCYYPSTTSQKKHYRHSDSFSSMNSESLSLCTEGLGFESCDDVEDLGNNNNTNTFNEAGFDFQPIHDQEKVCLSRQSSHPPVAESYCSKRSRTNKGASFPPPISCIGRTGKPWVCFKSYRQDGRFILQEIRFPIQEFLHACREDGRLRLQYIQSDDEILEGDEDEEDDEDEDDDSFDDVKDVNEEKIGNDLDDDDDNHEHHQQGDDEDADADDEAVQMGNNDVQDDSSE
ncbi:OLC1v1004630C1 [Oldenlandia corymbosa var. corymbosa]|uniref:OLC1v1004630C1 n=1 Tax=Oldenlandia corymbosa var. corymbosa TaxID=529605 RepID=A0AAV1DCP4_OLDCO|nr:OLC1v1004630C1 [Oldenlandia corymbosa var. corymbosa]